MAWANPPKVELGAPVRVSPFIRFCRWSLLVAGIAWGLHRHRTLTKKEKEHRALLRIKKIEWDKQQEIQKKIDVRNELIYLAKETGTPIPANFDQLYPDVTK